MTVKIESSRVSVKGEFSLSSNPSPSKSIKKCKVVTKKRKTKLSSSRASTASEGYFFYRLCKGVTNSKDPKSLLNRQLVWLSNSAGNNTTFHQEKGSRQHEFYSIMVPANPGHVTSSMVRASILENLTDEDRMIPQDILVVDERPLTAVNVSKEKSSCGKMMQLTSLLPDLIHYKANDDSDFTPMFCYVSSASSQAMKTSIGGSLSTPTACFETAVNKLQGTEQLKFRTGKDQDPCFRRIQFGTRVNEKVNVMKVIIAEAGKNVFLVDPTLSSVYEYETEIKKFIKEG